MLLSLLKLNHIFRKKSLNYIKQENKFQPHITQVFRKTTLESAFLTTARQDNQQQRKSQKSHAAILSHKQINELARVRVTGLQTNYLRVYVQIEASGTQSTKK